MNKRKISATISPFNYEMLWDLSYLLYKDNSDAEGNISATLDFLLNCLRLKSNFSAIIDYMQCRVRYKRGIRDRKTLEKLRLAEAILLKIRETNTEKPTEEFLNEEHPIL